MAAAVRAEGTAAEVAVPYLVRGVAEAQAVEMAGVKVGRLAGAATAGVAVEAMAGEEEGVPHNRNPSWLSPQRRPRLHSTCRSRLQRTSCRESSLSRPDGIPCRGTPMRVRV